MLDVISTLQRQRDQTLDWIQLYIETGDLDAEQGEFLSAILKGEE